MTDRDQSRLAQLKTWLGRADRFVEWLLPHLTTLVGVVFIYRAWDPSTFVEDLANYPQVTMAIVGLLVFISARQAVGYRKKFRRQKRRADRYEEDLEEVLDMDLAD